MPRVHHLDCEIFYTVRGNGPCLVFLHGFIESGEVWDDYADALSSEYTVVCIDLPGHGKSGCSDHAHSIQFMADAVGTVLKSLSVSQCVMLGHSMGGYVTLRFADLYPQALKGFSLIHSHPYEDSEQKKQDRAMAIKIVQRNPAILLHEMIPNLFANKDVSPYPKAEQKLRKIAGQMTAEGLIKAMEGMISRQDEQKVLRETRLPVLIVLGTNDPVMDYAQMSQQTLLSPNIHALVLEGAGHMGFIEKRDELLEGLKLFAEGCFTA